MSGSGRYLHGTTTRPSSEELGSRALATRWTSRVLVLPVFVVSLSLVAARLYPAAMLMLAALVVLGFTSGLRYLARVARRRGVVAHPDRDELWTARPEVMAWDGLPRASAPVRSLLAVAVAACWLLALGLGMGAPLSAEAILASELVLLVAVVVALMWWWSRCDRAVWVWGLRWWCAWAGRPIRARLVPVGIAALAAIGLACWANALLSRSGVPWALGEVGVRCLDPAHPIWGMCVSAETLQAALRGDAVGNLGLFGLIFCIGYQNSLGGTPADHAESPAGDAVADGWQ